jgi:glycosyltransferase involved in cell wall biosynthesis
VHDLIHLIEPSPRYRAYYHALLRPIVKRSGLVFTVSETSRALISRWIDDDSVRIVNTGNGCSSAFRRATPVAERRGLVYVGNLKAHKNFEVVLDALRLLEGVELVAVTPDPAGTKALAKLKGVDSQVVVASGLSDAQLANLYARSCASVLPSKMEGFGLPAVESLATRTPVIYWAGCEAVAEVVGANGAAVGSADDPVQWAEAIRFALAEPVEVAEDATSRYEWDSVAGVVNATLLDYLDGGSVVA